MNKGKKKSVGLQRTWVSKRTVWFRCCQPVQFSSALQNMRLARTSNGLHVVCLHLDCITVNTCIGCYNNSTDVIVFHYFSSPFAIENTVACRPLHLTYWVQRKIATPYRIWISKPIQKAKKTRKVYSTLMTAIHGSLWPVNFSQHLCA